MKAVLNVYGKPRSTETTTSTTPAARGPVVHLISVITTDSTTHGTPPTVTRIFVLVPNPKPKLREIDQLTVKVRPHLETQTLCLKLDFDIVELH